MDPQNQPLSPLDDLDPERVENPLEVMQPGERTLVEIRRHPIGLVGIYAVSGLVLAITISAAILIPIYATFLTNEQRMASVIFCAIIAILTIIVTYIGIFIYHGNRLVITTDSITDIDRTGLFNTRASQMSLANMEDVTAYQEGLIPTLFGYGVLVVQSASERSKIEFDLCPDPHRHARLIIDAHERFMARNPGSDSNPHNRPRGSVGGGMAPTSDQLPPSPISQA